MPPPTPARLRPSIAQPLLASDKTQPRAANIFTHNNNNPQSSPPSKLLLPFQAPFSIPHLLAAALALGSSSPMDHNHNHEHHDHSSPDHAMPSCSMNMIFNTNPIGTCIVFERFRVSGPVALVVYLLLLFLVSVGYEYLRLAMYRFDRMTRVNPKLKPWSSTIGVPRHIQITRSLFYVSNVALSFFLMLVVMTYNAQIIAAVLVGAFVGHFIFHRELSVDEHDKGMACH